MALLQCCVRLTQLAGAAPQLCYPCYLCPARHAVFPLPPRQPASSSIYYSRVLFSNMFEYADLLLAGLPVAG